MHKSNSMHLILELIMIIIKEALNYYLIIIHRIFIKRLFYEIIHFYYKYILLICLLKLLIA